MRDRFDDLCRHLEGEDRQDERLRRVPRYPEDDEPCVPLDEGMPPWDADESPGGRGWAARNADVLARTPPIGVTSAQLRAYGLKAPNAVERRLRPLWWRLHDAWRRIANAIMAGPPL